MLARLLVCFGSAWIVSLSSCQVSQPLTITPDTLPAQLILPSSQRSMAWDGEKLWLVLRENQQAFLVAQSLLGKQSQKLPLASDLSDYLSLSWGQGKLWLLDQYNTIHVLGPDGRIQQKIPLTELPEPRTAEQIVWIEDQLWLLRAAYLSSQNQLDPATFYRLDPLTGKIQASLVPRSVSQLAPRNGFSNFFHQNLSADTQAFYSVRSSIFEKGQNAVYRVDRRSGEVSVQELGRIYTGLPTSFWWQGRLFGVELLDTNNCGEFCRGKLEKLK